MEEAYFWASHDFLAKILKESENNSNMSIHNSFVQNANGKGDNYISNLFRVTVESENPVKRKTFFVKVLPDEGIVRDLIEKTSTFPNEIRMYRETLPMMNKALARAACGKFGNLCPECYYLSKVEEPVALIMEDMAEKGYIMANRRKGLDLNHCLLVMKTIAIFHASSLAVHEDNPSSIETYTTNYFFEESAYKFWNNCFKQTMTTMAEVVRKWDHFGDKFADKMCARAETFRDDFVTFMNAKDDAFKVLVHGDLWLNNILFRYSKENGEPEDAMLIDFQFCFFTSPGIDLQYFIHSSPKESVRVNHTEDLLRAYHTELCDTLRLLGLGHKVITFQQLLEEYEKKSLFGMFIGLYCLPVILSEPSDAFDFECVLRDEFDKDAVTRRTMNEEFSVILKRLLKEYENKELI